MFSSASMEEHPLSSSSDSVHLFSLLNPTIFLIRLPLQWLAVADTHIQVLSTQPVSALPKMGPTRSTPLALGLERKHTVAQRMTPDPEEFLLLPETSTSEPRRCVESSSSGGSECLSDTPAWESSFLHLYQRLRPLRYFNASISNIFLWLFYVFRSFKIKPQCVSSL